MAMPPLQRAFGQRVKELRRARGHSQEGFAALANLDRGAFGKLERGEINVGLVSMARIAAALEITLAELFDGVTFNRAEILALARSARGPKPHQAQPAP